MTYRPFSEVISTYRSRFNGLREEYETVKYRWQYLSSILSDRRILPDLSRTAFKVIPNLLSDIDERVKECEKIASSAISSDLNIDRDSQMNFVSENLLLAAHLIGYMKSGFSQRTDFLEIPYVIAGQPSSLETHWGDEQYLIAADNLISNYYDQLDLAGFAWSGFTSYALMHPDINKFPGATYANGEQMFHITLSSEMRYFLNGFLVVVHELGHAAVECRETTVKGTGIPEVIFRFLWWFHKFRGWIYSETYRERFTKRNQPESMEKRCKDCFLKKELEQLTFTTEVFEDFVVKATSSEFIQLAYEVISDIIGQVISGQHYPRALFDYAFSNIVDLEDESPRLDSNFETMFARIAACAYFAEMQGNNRENFEKIALEVFASIAPISDSRKSKLVKCLNCTKRLGRTLGYVIGIFADHIFANTFSRANGVHPTFRDDPTIVDRIRNNQSVVDFEPRQIVSACFDLTQSGYKELPVALFSLANNSKVAMGKIRKNRKRSLPK